MPIRSCVIVVHILEGYRVLVSALVGILMNDLQSNVLLVPFIHQVWAAVHLLFEVIVRVVILIFVVNQSLLDLLILASVDLTFSSAVITVEVVHLNLLPLVHWLVCSSSIAPLLPIRVSSSFFDLNLLVHIRWRGLPSKAMLRLADVECVEQS